MQSLSALAIILAMPHVIPLQGSFLFTVCFAQTRRDFSGLSEKRHSSERFFFAFLTHAAFKLAMRLFQIVLLFHIIEDKNFFLVEKETKFKIIGFTFTVNIRRNLRNNQHISNVNV